MPRDKEDKIAINVPAIEHWLIDASIHTRRELAERSGISESNLITVLKSGFGGEFTVLRLEKFLGFDIRVENKHDAS